MIKRLLLLSMALLWLSMVASHMVSTPAFGEIVAKEPNYFSYGDDEEVRFRLSVMSPVFTDGWPHVSYTLDAWWPIKEQSGPFRELNHNPAIFGLWHPGGWLEEIQAGYEHQSNGQDDIERDDGVTPSRSWERLFIDSTIRITPWLAVRPKLWYAFWLQENEDILDTYGPGQLTAILTPWIIDMRYTGRRGSERGFDLVEMYIPLPWMELDLYASWFDGHGESMVDLPGTHDTFDPERRTVLRVGLAIR